MTHDFETERLIARPFTPDDAEGAWALWGDPEVMHFLGGVVETGVESTRASIARFAAKYAAYRERGLPHGAFALLEKASAARGGSELIGCGLLKPLPDADKVDTDDIEIGWHLVRRVWGHGYATEAGRALMDRGFSRLPIDRLHVVIDPGNVRSQRVAERLGFSQHEDTRRYYGRHLHHYTRTRAAWESAR